MSKQFCKQVTIVIRGDDESDIEQGIDEAVRLVQNGCRLGHNSNDTGAFYFAVSDHVRKKDWPA